MRLPIVALGLLFAVAPVLAEEPAVPPADEYHLQINLDPAEQGGVATASVRVHATPEVLWQVLTSCSQAVEIVPGLKVCDVLETAPDRSWQRIREVMDYSWLIPRVSYEIKANYTKPSAISFEKVAGDLKRLKGSWTLQTDGEYTVAQYDLDFVPGFWVPRWFVRAALKRDLPKMLRAVREHAEAAQRSPAG
jgi:ribosome-associated toxin RatA of RatAB toxin-antitoxin module